MSKFFDSILASANQSQSDRLKAIAEKASLPQPTQIGAVTGFDHATGEYIVTTADGGTQSANLGNFGAPPSQVSLSNTKNSYTTFADFRAPQ
jgi:hypothetical protein